MSIVNAKEILVEAAQGRYAIGAFNVTNLVQMEGVIDAAVDKRSPVILQVSARASKFLGADVPVAIYRAIAATAPVPISLHLNHCIDVDYCKTCADAGYSSVMVDASRESFEENVRRTREVVEYCHTAGNIGVEGELGTVAGVEDQKSSGDEAQLANPQQSVHFVEATGVDMFAPAIGTAHGVYRTRTPKVDFERLACINEMLNGGGIRTPLVVHGSTGLPEEYIRRLIEAGGAKFNISTELERTLIDAQYDYIAANRQEYEPGRVDIAIRDAIRKAVAHWIEALGSAGRA